MTSPNEQSQAPAPPCDDSTRTCSPEPDLRLVLMGYVPMSQNRARGAHWSQAHREKLRAIRALHAAIACDLQSTQCDPRIGTTLQQSRYRIALSKLDYYQAMIGKRSKDQFVRAKRKRGAKSGQ